MKITITDIQQAITSGRNCIFLATDAEIATLEPGLRSLLATIMMRLHELDKGKDTTPCSSVVPAAKN